MKDLAPDINVRSFNKKWHGLHKATYNGHLNVIKFLLDQ